MFSGMGWETVAGCRQYFYIRHIDWAITCPLIIFSLGLLATQDLATILAGKRCRVLLLCLSVCPSACVWHFLTVVNA